MIWRALKHTNTEKIMFLRTKFLTRIYIELKIYLPNFVQNFSTYAVYSTPKTVIFINIYNWEIVRQSNFLINFHFYFHPVISKIQFNLTPCRSYDLITSQSYFYFPFTALQKRNYNFSIRFFLPVRLKKLIHVFLMRLNI